MPASGAAISRPQFTTGAGHRRGRARQTRPMRSRCPPCRRQQRSVDLTRNTSAPHFTPQHWLLCHMGMY